MSDYDSTFLAVNLIVLAIQIVAKLPELHGVRLFHVNEAKVD